ncbi:MAG: P-loop NTPase fold protein [Clostridia bacterium]
MNAKDEIYSYIGCKEDNGALLVSGKWGCGKSYLVKEIAEELHSDEKAEIIAKKIGAKERYAVAIVSLFGVDSIEKLNQKVKENVFWLQKSSKCDDKSRAKITKAKENVSQLASAFSTYSKVAAGINAVLSVDVYNFVEVKNKIECWDGSNKVTKTLVLVFDDFERSKLDEIELLGSINEYSENRKIKTIVIADETKIKKEKNGKDNDEESNDNTKFSYAEFKEKVIFRTVQVAPKHYEVVNCLVAGYSTKSEKYKNFLGNNKDLIAKVFIESKYENIRSLKSAVINFERVYDIMRANSVAEEYIEKVLYLFTAITFEYKADNYKESDYGYLFSDISFQKKYSNYNKEQLITPSIRDWIVKGEWKPEDIRIEIGKIYVSKEITPEQKFLIYDFWSLSYQDIFDGLPVAVEKAYNGYLTCDELISLLEKVTGMKIHNVDLPCKIDCKKMEEGLDNREIMLKNGAITKDERHRYITDETLHEMSPEMKSVYNKVVKNNDRQCLFVNKRDLIKHIRSGNSIPMHEFRGAPIDSFDDELLDLYLRRYVDGDDVVKRELDYVISHIHIFNNGYSTDEEMAKSKENFQKLIEELKIIQKAEEDKMVKAYINISIREIQKCLDKAK